MEFCLFEYVTEDTSQTQLDRKPGTGYKKILFQLRTEDFAPNTVKLEEVRWENAIVRKQESLLLSLGLADLYV